MRSSNDSSRYSASLVYLLDGDEEITGSIPVGSSSVLVLFAFWTAVRALRESSKQQGGVEDVVDESASVK